MVLGYLFVGVLFCIVCVSYCWFGGCIGLGYSVGVWYYCCLFVVLNLVFLWVVLGIGIVGGVVVVVGDDCVDV